MIMLTILVSTCQGVQIELRIVREIVPVFLTAHKYSLLEPRVRQPPFPVAFAINFKIL